MVLFNPWLGGGDTRVHTFPEVINLKLSVIARREFELSNYDYIVQDIS